MTSLNPRVWLRDWLKKPTRNEAALAEAEAGEASALNAYQHCVDAFVRQVESAEMEVVILQQPFE